MELAGSSPTRTTASPGTIPWAVREATSSATWRRSLPAISVPLMMSAILISEDHGLVRVDENTILQVIQDGARQHPLLDIASLADQVFRRVGMCNRLDILGDDRPLIEVGGHEVRGRTDHLDAACVGLMIG